ncbi:MAG: two-component sensor histidine kinase [Leifsonia sp.]|mgnify:CR=1 FL=1|nr:two-component sensor histidine kinase [Leifsonia sp.]|tara:strand:- start:18354 stop:19502 length:1149 start_codon:yes stop_codon:yes gene_type:complete
MKDPRWWDLAILGTSAVLAVIVAFAAAGPRQLAGLLILLAFAAAWLAIGRPAYRRENFTRMTVFLAVTVLVTGGLTAIHPTLAISQCIAYPIVWALAPSTRRSIVANLGIAVAVGAGFLASLGTSPAAVLQTAVTVSVSLAFSLALGLWITRIARFGEEKARLLEQLTDAQRELEVLHRDHGATAERERFARELHDTIAQSLTGIVLLTQQARREFRTGRLDDAALEMLETAARDTLTETRSLVAGTAPVDLGGGITTALARLAARFERETGMTVTLEAAEGIVLDRDVEVVVLRCAQEGLANVRKHSAASHARIELSIDDGAARVRVIDDGVGFDPTVRRGAGFGLDGLTARVELVGGTVSVDGTPGATTLTARVPLGAGS